MTPTEPLTQPSIDAGAPAGRAGAHPLDLPGPTVMVIAWDDPIVEQIGFDVSSEYVDLYWLGVLGPTSTWLLRHLARDLDRYPLGYELDLGELAATVGVGGPNGPTQQFAKALHRCEHFGVVRCASEVLVVRRHVPPVSQRHLLRLPAALRQRHQHWVAPAQDSVARRTTLLAEAFFAAGDEPARIERQLIACGVGPSTAAHLAAGRGAAVLSEPGPPRDGCSS